MLAGVEEARTPMIELGHLEAEDLDLQDKASAVARASGRYFTSSPGCWHRCQFLRHFDDDNLLAKKILANQYALLPKPVISVDRQRPG